MGTKPEIESPSGWRRLRRNFARLTENLFARGRETETWRLLAEQSPDIIVAVNAALDVVFVNRAFPGMSKQTLVGCYLPDLIPGFTGIVESSLKASLASGRPAEFQFDLGGPGSGARHYTNRVRPIRGLTSEAVLLLTSTDVTEVVIQTRLREESERRYRVLAEKSIDALFIADETFRFIYVNSRATSMLGYTEEELLTMTIPQVTHIAPGDKPLMLGDASDGLAEIHERRMNCKDGSLLPVDVSGIKLENGHYLAFIRDVSARKKDEEELAKYRDHLENLVKARTAELEVEKARAQEADVMKTAFLSTMSHELRTPLNSIIGFASTVLSGMAGPVNAEQIRQLTMVKDSGKHLLGIINDILDISRVEAGRLEIVRNSFDYMESVNRLFESVRPQVEAKRLSLTVETSRRRIPMISDQRRVEQILLNLLSNAIKFTQRGSIAVWVEVSDSTVTTSVRDTGIGINAEGIGQLFIPFRQLDTGLSRGSEGTGLGLSISQKLLAALGGEIWVQSVPGEGSTFTYSLPLVAPAE